jgi:hypothetical protein
VEEAEVVTMEGQDIYVRNAEFTRAGNKYLLLHRRNTWRDAIVSKYATASRRIRNMHKVCA